MIVVYCSMGTAQVDSVNAIQLSCIHSYYSSVIRYPLSNIVFDVVCFIYRHYYDCLLYAALTLSLTYCY